jgi:hypothetical protein
LRRFGASCRFRRNCGREGTWEPSGGFGRASNIHFPIVLEFTHQLLNLITGELRENLLQILKPTPLLPKVLDMLEEERLVRLTIEPTLARIDALLAKKRIKAS